jgi:hypothetical protein
MMENLFIFKILKEFNKGFSQGIWGFFFFFDNVLQKDLKILGVFLSSVHFDKKYVWDFQDEIKTNSQK